MTQLQSAYQMLESSGAKREKLEMAMRARLEAEVKRLRDANQLLQGTSYETTMVLVACLPAFLLPACQPSCLSVCQ